MNLCEKGIKDVGGWVKDAKYNGKFIELEINLFYYFEDPNDYFNQN